MVVSCPHCAARVMPTSDGRCPACKAELSKGHARDKAQPKAPQRRKGPPTPRARRNRRPAVTRPPARKFDWRAPVMVALGVVSFQSVMDISKSTEPKPVTGIMAIVAGVGLLAIALWPRKKNEQELVSSDDSPADPT